MTVGRLRHRIPRSRVPRRLRLLMDPAALRYWAGVVLLAALVATIVGRSIATAEGARRAWGRTTTVVVAADDLDQGAPLDPGALREARWPAALVPPGALRRAPPDGSSAATSLAAGVVLTDGAVRAPGRAHDRRTVAVAIDREALPVGSGDRVDVWAIADPALVPDGAERAERVARGAEVVRTTEGAVVVAVAPGEVEATASAAASATVVLVGST